MKNVLLLCLSPFKAGENIKTSQYSYQYGDSIIRVEGIVTNEAPAKSLIQRFHVDDEHIDKIVMICSDTVRNKMNFGNKDTTSLNNHIQRCINLGLKDLENKSHVNVYKRLINTYALSVDPSYEENPIEFVEIKISNQPEDNEITEAVIEAADNIVGEDNQVELFIDYNGGQRFIAFMILAIANLMKIREININQILTMNFESIENGVVPIQNMGPVFESFDLVSGINEYINYGRIKGLKNYFASCNNQEIKSIIGKMEEFGNNLQLCRTGYLMEHREELWKTLQSYSEKADKSKNPDTYEQVFEYVVEDILNGYSRLLKGKLPDVIEWCVDKDFIQQALTFCSEEIPGYFWTSGIFKAAPAEQKEYDYFLEKVHCEEGEQDNPPTEVEMEARNNLQRFYQRKYEPESSKYAYEWMISYLPYSCVHEYNDNKEKLNNDYDNIMISAPEEYKVLLSREPIKVKEKESKRYYRELKAASPEIIKDEIEKRRNIVTPLYRQTIVENPRAQTNKDGNVFIKIMVLYYLLKDQRNLTNHADDSKNRNTWSYDDLCMALKQFVEALKQ